MPELATTETTSAVTPQVRRRGRPRREIDTRGMETQKRHAVIAVEGPASIDVEPFEVIQGPKAMSKAALLAAAEEELIIIIHASMERNPEDPVPVGVGGRMCYIWRNKKSIVKRKYVERLARAKSDNIQQDVTNQTDPLKFNSLTITQGQKYPLSILEDPSPKYGLPWLEKIMAEA